MGKTWGIHGKKRGKKTWKKTDIPGKMGTSWEDLPQTKGFMGFMGTSMGKSSDHHGNASNWWIVSTCWKKGERYEKWEVCLRIPSISWLLHPLYYSEN